MNENFVDDQNFFIDFTDQFITSINVQQNVLQCRICEKVFSQEEGIDIFNQNSDILEKMHFYLFIFVHPNDNLSKHICIACYNHLTWLSDLPQKSVPTVNQPTDLDIFKNFNLMPEPEDNKNVPMEPIYVLPKPIKNEDTVDQFSPANFETPTPSFSDPSQFLVKQRDLSDQDDNSSSEDAFLFKNVGKCGIPFDAGDNFSTSSEQLGQYPCSLLSDFSCHNCNEKFSTVQLYRKHIEVCLQNITPGNENQLLSSNQKGLGVFVCDICNANFNRFNLLAKHQLKHKPKSEWTEKCHVCDLSFERQTLLARHVKTAHAEYKADQSPWKCRHCGKHMMTKLSLGIHERIHTGAKPYVCEWCGQRFRSRANLLQHHPKHTGIKKHKCEECGKLFSRKSFVTAHMRVHTGERPFSCGICDRKFTQIGDMRRHEKKHEISIKHGRTCYTVIDINNNHSSDSVGSGDSDDRLTDGEIALKVKVIQDC